MTCGFAASAGWSDVICFRRYASFAALMTGNTVKAGIAAATPEESGLDRAVNVLYYLCIVITYMLGGTLFQFIKNWKPQRTGCTAAPVCLLLVLACELCNQVWGNNRWQVCVLAPTFGIQNSLTFGGAMETNTTIITGNTQKLSLALYQALTRKLTRAKCQAIATPSAAIVSTFVASVLGAFVLMDVAGMQAAWLFVPAGLLQCCCLVLHDVAFQDLPAAGREMPITPAVVEI